MNSSSAGIDIKKKVVNKHGYRKLVDVIIPAKDEENVIFDTVFKLTCQTLFKNNFVKIIIGDYNPENKTTKTREILQTYFGHLIKNDKLAIIDVTRPGIAHARNSIIRHQHCQAPIIATLDADSYYSNDNGLYNLVYPLINGFAKDELEEEYGFISTVLNQVKYHVSVCGVKFYDVAQNNLLNKGCEIFNDYIKLLPVGIGSATAFTRYAYDYVGGYDEFLNINIGDINVNMNMSKFVGEDMFLVNKICNGFGLFTKVFIPPEITFVYTSGRRHKNLLKKGLDIFDYSNAYRE